jgi:protoheme IX farnesyltransferase
VILHTLTTFALWTSLILLVYASGVLIQEDVQPAALNGRQRLKDFFALNKPLIVGLLLITTYGGLVIGMRAWPSFSLTMWTLLGGGLAAGGSSALNQYIDRELDKNMQRTAKRPLADGRLTNAEGLAFGLGLTLISYYLLACCERAGCSTFAGRNNLLRCLLQSVAQKGYRAKYCHWRRGRGDSSSGWICRRDRQP